MGQPVVAGDEKTGSSDADGGTVYPHLKAAKIAEPGGSATAVAHRVLVEIRERLEWLLLTWRKCPPNQAEAKIDTEQDLRRNFK